MELDKIIEAVKDKELGSDVIDAIKALDQTGTVERLTKELESEQGKSKGILDDKRKYKDRAETAENTLKEQADSKLPADELHKKQLQELEDKLAEGTRLREEQDATHKADARENATLKINSGIRWDSKRMPATSSLLLTKNALAGIDDLSDASKVSEVVKSLTESHASFISANAPSGSGDKGVGGNGGASGSDNKPSSMKDIMADVWNK
jgi:hypothetical protein